MNCQSHLYRDMNPRFVNRRWFLQQCKVGLGAMALSQLGGNLAMGDSTTSLNPMAPKQSHFSGKVKRVIYLFMAGAPSQLEMFDHKPELAKRDGLKPPAKLIEGYRAAFIEPDAALLGPKFKFARHGQSGAELSELLPHMAEVVDDIAIVRSMKPMLSITRRGRF